MCHAALFTHPCGHPSFVWGYCPESGMTGEGDAPPCCDVRTFERHAAPSSEACPLTFCDFVEGSTWYVSLLLSRLFMSLGSRESCLAALYDGRRLVADRAE